MMSPDSTESNQSQLTEFSEFGEVERTSVSRVQQIAAKFLARNWAEIPHVTHHDDADVTALDAVRERLSAEAEGTRYSALPFLMKALVLALQEYPQFNASLEPDGRNLLLKKYFNLGFAVDTPKGLLVPVVRGVERKSVGELAREMYSLSQQARDKGLSIAQMSGGCFTISSLGSIGGTGFTPIINAPEVAILGVSATQWKPRRVASGERELEWWKCMPLSLSYDHRAINGADAARFTQCIAKILARPEALLAG